MKQYEKYQTGITILILAIIFSCNFIYAFGVGSAYHENYPLEISAGESIEVTFNLQNGPGPLDINFKAAIVEGSEIMQLLNPQEIYFLPVGGSLDVKAVITAPLEAEIGDTYPVRVSFNTIAENDGEFGFGSSVSRKFDVIIVPTEEEKIRLESQKTLTIWTIYILGGVILLGLLVWFVHRKMKK